MSSQVTPASSAPTPHGSPSPVVRPIILGGDIGAYATARAFHQEYGVRSVVVAGVATGPVQHSAIVDLRVHADMTQPAALVRILRSIAAEQPRAHHLVLASADWLVEQLVAVGDELSDVVTIPYASSSVIAAVSDKAVVMRACRSLGVPHPDTQVVVPGHAGVDLERTSFPAIVKPASTTAAHSVTYPGQAKVHTVTSPEQLNDLLAVMATAGFDSQVLVQEMVPGDDDSMAAVNVFIGPQGEVRFAQMGRVLLEDHTPSALGNSVAQVTVDASHDAVARAVIDDVLRLLHELGMTGFANVDLKRDATGVYRLFEINPRVGRSGYAVTASGYNVAAMYVDAYLSKKPAGERVIGSREHLFTVVPVALVGRYAPSARGHLRRLRRARAVTNPLFYRREHDPRRWFYIASAMVNQVRQFRAHHPAGDKAR